MMPRCAFFADSNYWCVYLGAHLRVTRLGSSTVAQQQIDEVLLQRSAAAEAYNVSKNCDEHL